jgi:protein-S-isoprenylcysteine O-methyltransferase Ste14
MYAGLVLASLGALLLYRTWATLFFVVQLPTLVARARLEEKALAAEFGPAWEAYRARVPGWMPHLGR